MLSLARRPIASVVPVVLVAMASVGPTAPRSWALGTFVKIPGGVSDCPAGYRCMRFVVTGCPSVSQDIGGELAVGGATGSPVGMVTFFSGGTGEGWWTSGSSRAESLLSRLRRQNGLSAVQVRWVTPWLASAPGEDAGSAHLACRPATAIQWIHDNLYEPVAPLPGACGFCLTGSSGGASEVSYALSHFGLDSVLDAVVPTSGPPHAAQTKGCLPGWPGFRYAPEDVQTIDSSYGFSDPAPNPGPCMLHDEAWIPRWTEESVDTGGSDYDHPATRIEFIIGGQDPTVAPAHAGDYRDVLLADPANHVTWTLVPDMPHDVQLSSDGLRALETALLGSISGRTPLRT